MGRKDKNQAGSPAEEQRDDELVEEGAEGKPQETRYEQIERERAEYLALWQRAQADYQNLKRRSFTDLEAGVRRALQPLLEDLLLVMDHMEMALASPIESEDAKNLAFGVELVKKQLLTALSNQDVQAIEPGKHFDPALHQAVAKETREDLEPDSVIETLRRGYLWKETPLRFAQVRVAEPPAETTAGPAGAADSDAGDPAAGDRRTGQEN